MPKPAGQQLKLLQTTDTAMAGGLIDGWTPRDVENWREELSKARRGTTQRKTAVALVAAAASYVGACAWIPVIKELGCPGGRGCREMETWEMAVFSIWVSFFTFVIIVLVYLLYTIRYKLDAWIKGRGTEENVSVQPARTGPTEVREAARLASVAQGKTVDLVAGNTVYACVFLWTVSLHSFTSYTTLSGVWEYFAAMVCLSASLTVMSFEIAPIITAKLRTCCPALVRDKTQGLLGVGDDQVRPSLRPAGLVFYRAHVMQTYVQEKSSEEEKAATVLVAKAFQGAMAWLLAVALVNALEVPCGRPPTRVWLYMVAYVLYMCCICAVYGSTALHCTALP
jgi:hypothetical protein